MTYALLKHTLDLFRSNQRTRGIMHRDIFCERVEMIQTGAYGILPVFATGDDRPNLLKIFIANDRFDFIVSILTSDDDDSIGTFGVLKCAYRVRDDWCARYRRKQFVEAHAAAVTGRDEDC